MSWSIFEHENNFVRTTKEEINGIPCLKFKPIGYEGLMPTVIYYHGWHSSKEFMIFEAQIIATNGYQVIVPDALYHGERNPINHDDPENLDKYLWTIILQSVKESSKFMEDVINEHDADPKRIAVMGSSMGAMIAGGVFVHNPNLKCLIAFNGTFAWQEFIDKNYVEPAKTNNMEFVKNYDPMSNIDKINERAILIIHGIEDTSVPIESQRYFYDNVSPLYMRNPEMLGFIEEINVNHRTTIGMLQDAVSWLKKCL